MKFKFFIKVITFYYLIIFFFSIKNNIFKSNNHKYNNSSLFENYKFFIDKNDSLYFNIIEIKYCFSIKYKILRLKYKILIFDKKKNNVLPSDLPLYNNLHIICFIIIQNENIEINSFPNINNNKYYECIEFMNINEKIKFGIKIFESKEKKENAEIFRIFLFPEKNFIYKNLTARNHQLFDPLFLNQEYIKLTKIYNLEKNENLRLKKSYILFPISILKREIALNENKWYYRNLYNIYFCFCKGSFCKMNKRLQNCKYHIFLNIIDQSRKLYKKEDYLFLDFVFSEYSSDDVYPIFKQMLIQKQPSHYLTENMDIYNEYCYKKTKCIDIIYVNKNNYTMNGDFLEKYLTLILKLNNIWRGD